VKAARHLTSLAATAKLRLKGLPEPTGRPPEKLLVLGYAAIGDFIFFMPVLEALRAAYPKAKLVFLANPNPVTRELVPAAGLADEVWLHDWEGPEAAAEQKEINRRIAGFGFDAAVLSLSSPAHYFQEGLASIPLRVGHGRPKAGLRRRLVTGEPARRALLNRLVEIPAASQPAAARNLRLLAGFGLPVPSDAPRPRLPVPEADRAWAAEKLRAAAAGKKLVGLHLGPPRNQYHKIWSPERFGDLCAELARRHPVQFIVVGDGADAESLAAARRRFEFPLSFVGEANLTRTFALIERCALFLSNDTGPVKAAGALGVPTVTLMGLSDPVEVGIPWEPEKHLIARTGISCSPCASLGMAVEGRLNYLTCGHHDCMTKLELSAVLAAVEGRFGALLDT
jgi:ADP-heptose:LPS heptosyltransferase